MDSSEILSLIDRLDQLVFDAKPIPLTDQVRLDKEEVYDVLDQMRASLPPPSAQAGPEPAAPATSAAATALPADEAARSLPQLLHRVKFGGEAFVIEQHGVEMAELRPPPG